MISEKRQKLRDIKRQIRPLVAEKTKLRRRIIEIDCQLSELISEFKLLDRKLARTDGRYIKLPARKPRPTTKNSIKSAKDALTNLGLSSQAVSALLSEHGLK